jgi:succinyl-diaminopimelate desuccinylase
MYAHKGSLNYKVVSKGMAAHSSSPELGNNAIEHLNVAMSQISDRIAQTTKNFSNDTLGQTFHNITMIKGGIQVNSIPDYAEFEANARTIPEFDNQAVMAQVQSVIDSLNQQQGFELDVAVTADQPPVQSRPDSELIKAILATVQENPALQVDALLKSMGDVVNQDLTPIAEQFGLDKIAPMVASGTTDAAQFTQKNNSLDLAVYGPGMPMLNHKIDERIPLQQYFDFIEAYKAVISAYLS